MADSEFSLARVSAQFDLSFAEAKLYEEVEEVPVGPILGPFLERHEFLARAIGTEKARSEFLIAPILAEVCARLDDRVSLFSGIDLPGAPDRGLNGVCDFLFSRSSQQFYLARPVIAVVEAKNENLSSGYGQCVAEMVGARFFNEREQAGEPVMYGVVTTGTAWRFLRLEGASMLMDRREYHVERVGKLLGIMVAMLHERALGPVAPPVLAAGG